jgi:hypothetical protein
MKCSSLSLPVAVKTDAVCLDVTLERRAKGSNTNGLKSVTNGSDRDGVRGEAQTFCQLLTAVRHA